MQQIGHYQVRRELARGGMGVVYHAWDPHLERDVAIKVILSAGQVTPEDLERFRTEARATARLRHPHIVAIHGVGLAAGGQPFLVMDLIEGGSLKSRIDAQGPLPLDDATRITREVANALHFAHERGVLHRDVKPHNILLDQGGRSFLTDFGLAKLLNLDTGITLSGETVGTPVYMPPEQANADTAKIGRPSDVYALGGTLYHMLTGNPPFSGTTVIEVLNKVLTHDPEPPSVLRAEVGERLEAVCLRCLAKEPNERYENAAAVAEALTEEAPDRPSKRRVTRHGSWITLSIAASGLAIGLALGMLLGGDEERIEVANRRIEELERSARESTTQRNELARKVENTQALILKNRERELGYLRDVVAMTQNSSNDPNLMATVSRHLLLVGTNQTDLERVLRLTERLLELSDSALGHRTRGEALAKLEHFDDGLRVTPSGRRAWQKVCEASGVDLMAR